MFKAYLPVIALLGITGSFYALSAQKSFWPNNTVAAVSLSYDDALASHLDNALPVLNKYDIKASFYLTLSSPVFKQRRQEWIETASQGHELGNHTIYHACRGSLPNRDWVSKDNDLDNKTIEQLANEVILANTLLQTVDNEHVRSFSLPCSDTQTKEGNYLNAITPLFIATQSRVGPVADSLESIDLNNMAVISAHNLSGEALINYVKLAHKYGTMVSFNFHGIGDDYLITSKQAHQRLINYLAENRTLYWVDTVRNIASHIKQNRHKPNQP